MDIQLSRLLRRKIVVLGPRLLNGHEVRGQQETLQTVTLLGVDAAGIWVESEEAADRIADRFRVKPAGRSAFFLPFAQITTIIASIDSADTQPLPSEPTAA